jgi:hypothetical protein
VPNKCPFKEEILNEMQAQSDAVAAQKELQRAEYVQKRKEAKEEKLKQKASSTTTTDAKTNLTNGATNLEQLAKRANKRRADFELDVCFFGSIHSIFRISGMSTNQCCKH